VKFRIIELLAVVSVVGLAFVSLKQPEPWFETIFFSLTLVTVVTSILLAVGRTGGARAFWTGFAITSLSYLGFAHLPDAYERVPRHNGPEITTKLLQYGLGWMHPDNGRVITSSPGGMFSIQDNPFDTPADFDPFATRTGVNPFGPSTNDDSLSTTPENPDTPGQLTTPFRTTNSLVIRGGQSLFPDSNSVSFMRIGHACWALLLGWMGGHFTRVVYQRSRQTRIEAKGQVLPT